MNWKWILFDKYFYYSGFGLGAALGLFSSSVNPTIVPGQELKTQTAREILREMKGTMLGYAKNFAMVGAMFSAIECTIESVSTVVYCILYFCVSISSHMFFRSHNWVMNSLANSNTVILHE